MQQLYVIQNSWCYCHATKHSTEPASNISKAMKQVAEERVEGWGLSMQSLIYIHKNVIQWLSAHHPSDRDLFSTWEKAIASGGGVGFCSQLLLESSRSYPSLNESRSLDTSGSGGSNYSKYRSFLCHTKHRASLYSQKHGCSAFDWRRLQPVA